MKQKGGCIITCAYDIPSFRLLSTLILDNLLAANDVHTPWQALNVGAEIHPVEGINAVLDGRCVGGRMGNTGSVGHNHHFARHHFAVITSQKWGQNPVSYSFGNSL